MIWEIIPLNYPVSCKEVCDTKTHWEKYNAEGKPWFILCFLKFGAWFRWICANSFITNIAGIIFGDVKIHHFNWFFYISFSFEITLSTIINWFNKIIQFFVKQLFRPRPPQELRIFLLKYCQNRPHLQIKLNDVKIYVKIFIKL